jgi:hypothetical protein
MMNFTAAKCPSCGGELQVPPERELVNCLYCGMSIVVRDAIQAAAPAETVENLLTIARTAAASNNSQEAYNYFTRILERAPTNVEAWCGKATAAGCMSTMSNLRLKEMVTGFDKALDLEQEAQKPKVRRLAFNTTNRLTNACHNLARKDLVETIRFSNTNGLTEWTKYLVRCSTMMDMFETAYRFQPNKASLENVISLCKATIDGMRSKNVLGQVQVVFLSPEFEAETRARLNEAAARLRGFVPGYVVPTARNPKMTVWEKLFNAIRDP